MTAGKPKPEDGKPLDDFKLLNIGAIVFMPMVFHAILRRMLSGPLTPGLLESVGGAYFWILACAAGGHEAARWANFHKPEARIAERFDGDMGLAVLAAWGLLSASLRALRHVHPGLEIPGEAGRLGGETAAVVLGAHLSRRIWESKREKQRADT